MTNSKVSIRPAACLLSLALVTGSGAASAQSLGAQVVIRQTRSNNTVSENFFNPNSPISLTVSPSLVTANIFTATVTSLNPNVYTINNPSINIGRVTLNGSVGALAVDIKMGTGNLEQGDFAPIPVGANWGGLSLNLSGNVSKRFQGGIGGNLTGSISGVNQLARFDAGGEINASIQVDSGINGGLFVLEAASFGANSVIRLSSGQITRVRARSGSMLGSVTIDNGDIGRVQCDGATLAASISAPNGQINEVLALNGSISSPTMSSGSAINFIDAFGPVSSAISAGGNLQRLSVSSGDFSGSLNAGSISSASSTGGVRINGGSMSAAVNVTGSVDRPIVVNQSISGLVTIAGNLNSTISAASLANDIRINETLSGSITINNGLASGRVIRIGDGLSGTINLPGGARLAGQVFINADQKAPAGVWTGTTSVGSGAGQINLTAPAGGNYANLSSTLGGGAVGVVPFNCHQAESTDRTQTLCSGGGSPQIRERTWPSGAPGFGNTRETVVVHHYGPLQYVGSTLPFVVERQSLFCEVSNCPPCDPPVCPGWEPLPTGHSPVIFLLAPSTVPIGQRAREVWVSTQDGTWPRGYRYRFTPASDANGTLLRSAGTLLSTAPPVASYTFVAEHWLCLDLNLSGGMDPGDLEAWFDHPVDVNDDAVADSVDMGIVADAVAGG